LAEPQHLRSPSQSSRCGLEENDEMVDLIKELGSEAITLSNAMSKTDNVKRWWRNNCRLTD
jgi:hypothetical protein